MNYFNNIDAQEGRNNINAMAIDIIVGKCDGCKFKVKWKK